MIRVIPTDRNRDALRFGHVIQIIFFVFIRHGHAGRGLGWCEPPNPFFHDLTRLESHHEFRIDFHSLIRPRIPGSPRFPQFDLEHSEVPQFNTPLRHKSVDNGVKCHLNDFFGLELRQIRLLGNLLNDFFLRHRSRPPDGG